MYGKLLLRIHGSNFNLIELSTTLPLSNVTLEVQINNEHDYSICVVFLSFLCLHLRTKVRGDFNIHGTKYFYDAVFHQKSKNYGVVSLPVPLVGQKTCALHEILTRLVSTEKV